MFDYFDDQNQDYKTGHSNAYTGGMQIEEVGAIVFSTLSLYLLIVLLIFLAYDTDCSLTHFQFVF